MDNPTLENQIEYDNPLVSIPPRKVYDTIRTIIDSNPKFQGRSEEDPLPKSCRVMIEAIKRYAETNIPVDYWELDMSNFKGDKSLPKLYDEVTSNIHKSYKQGIKYCLAGQYGVGKTMTCACILKKAVETGYTGLYVTLSDIISLMGSKDFDAKYKAKQYLLTTDFLVIDEFDPRFMGSENAAEFYGRTLETILRARIHNKVPFFLCTNSPNVTSGFSGPLKQSISSLMKLVKTIPVLGSDHRPVIASEKK